eukprot:2246674-Pleurochrysis_carterae.AAC.1
MHENSCGRFTVNPMSEGSGRRMCVCVCVRLWFWFEALVRVGSSASRAWVRVDAGYGVEMFAATLGVGFAPSWCLRFALTWSWTTGPCSCNGAAYVLDLEL